MPQGKTEIISLKVDAALLEAMKGIPNRSAFVRNAILQALANVCPLCGGTGALTPRQREHWEAFARTHDLRECDECHELHLVCPHDGSAEAEQDAS